MGYHAHNGTGWTSDDLISKINPQAVSIIEILLRDQNAIDLQEFEMAQ
jgi:hypothetical protein